MRDKMSSISVYKTKTTFFLHIFGKQKSLLSCIITKQRVNICVVMDNKFSKAIAEIENTFNREVSNITLKEINEIQRHNETEEYATITAQITVYVKVRVQSDSQD